jgi:GT2 family glycosyltransferase
MLKTAVVILNWNGLGFLQKFLDTVVLNSKEPDTTIWVADNGSTDGSAEWIEGYSKEVKLIRLNQNYGYAGGYNHALEQINAQYYVLLNSDIEVTPNWLSPLTIFLDENPEYAACQPKILSYHKKGYFEYAGAAGGFIDKYGYPFCRGRLFDVTEEDLGQYNDPIDVFWATGACMIVRADAWRKCGGLEPSFFAHMEEIDLCWRLGRSGYKLRYIPDSVIFHVGGGSLSYESPFKTYLNFRNSLYMLYRNLPNNHFHRIMFTRRLLDGLAAIMFLFKGKYRNTASVWKAHMDYYKNISELKSQRKELKRYDKGDIKLPVLNKSVVFEFYARGKKTYNALKWSYK